LVPAKQTLTIQAAHLLGIGGGIQKVINIK